MGLSKRALNIEPSGTQAVTQRIRDLKKEGGEQIVEGMDRMEGVLAGQVKS